MGCFPCFDSREEEKLNPQRDRDGPKEVHPAIPSNFSRLSSGKTDFNIISMFVGGQFDLIWMLIF